MTDPKARKVILVEHPLLPLYIKDLIARILFDNQVCGIRVFSKVLVLNIALGSLSIIRFKSSSFITCGRENYRSGGGLWSSGDSGVTGKLYRYALPTSLKANLFGRYLLLDPSFPN
jgi:hypothetical protein